MLDAAGFVAETLHNQDPDKMRCTRSGRSGRTIRTMGQHRGGRTGVIDGDTALLAYLTVYYADQRYDPVRQKRRRFCWL